MNHDYTRLNAHSVQDPNQHTNYDIGATNASPFSYAGCPYCSSPGQQIYHGGTCPRIKAIEYHPWGGIKRIEFHDVGAAQGETK